MREYEYWEKFQDSDSYQSGWKVKGFNSLINTDFLHNTNPFATRSARNTAYRIIAAELSEQGAEFETIKGVIVEMKLIFSDWLYDSI